MTVAEEISQLKKLFDQGVLTQEEFDAQKAKVLNRMRSDTQGAEKSQVASSVSNAAIGEVAVVPQVKKKTSACSVAAFVISIIGLAALFVFISNPGTDLAEIAALICLVSWLLTIIFSIIGLVQTFGKKKLAGKGFSIVAPSLLVISIIGVSVLPSTPTIDFSKTYSSLASQSFCMISSDGKTMEIDTNPIDSDDYSNNQAVRAIQQVNNDLGFGSSATTRMGNTRALDGTQTASSGIYTATWTYHPDKGLVVVYTIDR